MKAMILAAGRGTRVQPLTHEMPKPMIPLLGKPVMEYLIESLAAHGFDDIMINVSHLPKQIENYFGDGRRWGINIGYSFEGHIENDKIVSQPIGSAGGIKRIHEFGGFFDETFLVVCGDAIFDLDLTAALQQHKNSGAIASIVVKKLAKDKIENYGVVVNDADGRITSFQEKPKATAAKSNLVNSGIYFFEPQVLEHIPPAQNYDLGAQLLPAIIAAGLQIQAIEIPFHWIDIGRLSDYWSAHQKLMRGELEGVAMPGTEIVPQVWCGLNVDVAWDEVAFEGPIYIGANSRIAAGCQIRGPTWISHGCHLQSGAQVERSILFEHTLVRKQGHIKDALLFGRHLVDKDGNAIDSARGLDWVGDARGG